MSINRREFGLGVLAGAGALLAPGLAGAWQRLAPRRGAAVALVALALASVALTWGPWLSWHGGPPFGAWPVGLGLGLLVGGAGWAATRATGDSATPTAQKR